MKKCSKCNIFYSFDSFYAGNGIDGYHYWCKNCVKISNSKSYSCNKHHVLTKQAKRRIDKKEEIKKWHQENLHKRNANDAKRRATKLQSTPKWVNKFFIDEIYRLAKERTKLFGFDWHVDHIVPLQNKFVCGLHCEHNLKVIPAIENLKKHNKFY